MSKVTEFIEDQLLSCNYDELEEILEGSLQQLKDLKDLIQIEINDREKAKGE